MSLADAPVDLLERDRRDRGEEEEVDERLAAAHASDLRSSAVSSTLVERATDCAPRRRQLHVGQPAVREAAVELERARRASPSTSSGAATMPAPVSRISSAAAPSGGTAARIGRSAARYSKTLPESTPLPRPPASGISSSSASESRCSASEVGARRVRDQLEPVAEAEPLGPLAVGAAEVAEEAGDDVELRVVRAPAGTGAGRACRRSCRRG